MGQEGKKYFRGNPMSVENIAKKLASYTDVDLKYAALIFVCSGMV